VLTCEDFYPKFERDKESNKSALDLTYYRKTDIVLTCENFYPKLERDKESIREPNI